MRPYLDLLTDVMRNGQDRPDRTGTGTRSVFGRQLRYDLGAGFPLLTTKRLHFKSIAHELLWFLRGETDIGYLKAHGVRIWDEWATSTGALGPVYGAQWRAWRGPDGQTYDQVSRLIEGLRRNPYSRRHLISAWNVADLPDESLSPQENAAAGRMALAPCHVLYQFYVADGRLCCMMTQRSVDLFLGGAFNQASVALLTHIVAQQCDLAVGEIVLSFGDVHIYKNHFAQVEMQLARTPRLPPRLLLERRPESIFAYRYEDFRLLDYQPLPHIPAPVAV